MRPSASIGGIQAVVWLENETVAACTTNGYVRLIQYSLHDGSLVEDQHRPSDGGLTSAILLKRSGHLALCDSSRVTLWDPLGLRTAATIPLPAAADGIRCLRLQHCFGLPPRPNEPAHESTLLVGRSDGVLLRLPVPDLPVSDLTLLRVRTQKLGLGTPDSLDSAAGPAVADGAAAGLPSRNGHAGRSSGAAPVRYGEPRLLASATPADGASSGYGGRVHHAYSHRAKLLALVNMKCELIVLRRAADGALSEVLREQLPETQVVSCEWDPTSGTVLAVALAGYGCALWDTKAEAPAVQMWSGMAWKGGIRDFRISKKGLRKPPKPFDPVVAKWNLAGQLALGMSDGSFAVWDSMSLQVSTSTAAAGKHHSAITAADWCASLHAPALAFASRSTIKVSTGFQGVDWASTAMKLKGGTGPEEQAVDFESLSFSPSGKHLAAIANLQPGVGYGMSGMGGKVVRVYELQDAASALALRRNFDMSTGKRPVACAWLEDGTLLVFLGGDTLAVGGSVAIVRPQIYDLPI